MFILTQGLLTVLLPFQCVQVDEQREDNAENSTKHGLDTVGLIFLVWQVSGGGSEAQRCQVHIYADVRDFPGSHMHPWFQTAL